MNLSVDIAGVTMKNPVTTGSGTFGSGEEFSEFVDLSKLGAVTTKGVANVPWPGNPTPRVAEFYGGMLNAIGLQNPGIDVFVERDVPYLKKAGATDKFIIVPPPWHQILVHLCRHVYYEHVNESLRLLTYTHMLSMHRFHTPFSLPWKSVLRFPFLRHMP